MRILHVGTVRIGSLYHQAQPDFLACYYKNSILGKRTRWLALLRNQNFPKKPISANDKCGSCSNNVVFVVASQEACNLCQSCNLLIILRLKGSFSLFVPTLHYTVLKIFIFVVHLISYSPHHF